MRSFIAVRGGESYWVASIPALPGCAATGTSRDEAIAGVRGAVPRYLELLASRGMPTEQWRDLDPAALPVEDVAGPVALDVDAGPLAESDLRAFVQRADALRAETLAAIRGLDADDLERRPSEGSWCVREALEHVMTAEITYLARLERWSGEDGTLPALQAVRRMVSQRVAVMDPGEPGVDHTVLGRRTTTRFVLRRILEHEFEHQQQIREIIAALGPERFPE